MRIGINLDNFQSVHIDDKIFQWICPKCGNHLIQLYKVADRIFIECNECGKEENLTTKLKELKEK